MALPVIVIALGSAAVGAWVYGLISSAQARNRLEQGQRQDATNQFARELEKNKTYAVQMMVNPQAPDWPPQQTDLARSAALIKATFEQLGWRFPPNGAGDPKLRDQGNASRFFAGSPAEWILTATWIRDERVMPAAPRWLAMALPYQIPTR